MTFDKIIEEAKNTISVENENFSETIDEEVKLAGNEIIDYIKDYDYDRSQIHVIDSQKEIVISLMMHSINKLKHLQKLISLLENFSNDIELPDTHISINRHNFLKYIAENVNNRIKHDRIEQIVIYYNPEISWSTPDFDEIKIAIWLK